MNSIHLTSTVHIQTQPSYHSYQPPKLPPTTCDVLSCFHSISPVSRPICLILLSSSLHHRAIHDTPQVYEFWLSCCGEIQVLLRSRGRLCVEDKETISQEPLVIFPSSTCRFRSCSTSLSITSTFCSAVMELFASWHGAYTLGRLFWFQEVLPYFHYSFCCVQVVKSYPSFAISVEEVCWNLEVHLT